MLTASGKSVSFHEPIREAVNHGTFDVVYRDSLTSEMIFLSSIVTVINIIERKWFLNGCSYISRLIVYMGAKCLLIQLRLKRR